MSIADDTGLIVGPGTHLDTHTAAICDARGRAGSQLPAAATTEGYVRLLDWARREAAGRPVTWAIEGTRHYGLGLARYLASQGQQIAAQSGDLDVASRATTALGALLQEQGDLEGAKVAYQRVIDSGHAYMAPIAVLALRSLLRAPESCQQPGQPAS